MKFFVGFILFLIHFSALSQSIKGKVYDIENIPIEYVEVIIYELDKPILSDLTNSEGAFEFEISRPGQFRLQIRQQGSVFYEQDLFIDKVIDLGVITIDIINLLTEIVLTSEKKLIERKSDRIVYNVQNSVFSSGVSSDELLKNIPRIDPTTDGFKIIGKSNVLVMIDDKILNISGDDLKNYLKSIRSENIDKVEIITNPSAKYDASGNSGIIHIKMKKKSNLGFDGNISSTFIQRTKPSANSSVNLNYSNEKLILNYNLYLGNEIRFSNHKNDFLFVDEKRKSSENTERINSGITHNLNIDYQIFKWANIGTNINYGDWDNNSKRDSRVIFSDVESTINRSQNLPAETESSYIGISLSPYIDIKLDSLGNTLKLYYNYNKSNRISRSRFQVENYIGNFQALESIFQNTNDVDNNFRIDAFGADLETTFLNSKIDIGTKYTSFANDNDLQFFDIIDSQPVLDVSISNFFKYKERLFAVYANIGKEITDNIYFSGGLRYEHTAIEGVLISEGITNRNNYGNFFPNLSLSYDLNDNHSFSISYNRRITRPGLFDLNPFRVYSDANNYEVGNPNLLPNLTDNIELGHVYKGNLSITIFGSKILNNWAYIVETDNNNTTIITQPKNILTTYDFGAEIGYNWKINGFITNYSSANFSYQESNSSDPILSDSELRGYRGTLSSNTTFILNEEKTNKLFINLFYNTPGVEEMYISKNIFFLRLGTSLVFLSKKLTVNAYLTDPLNTTIARNTVNFESFQFQNRIFNDNRSISFSATYSFGNKKSKNINTVIDNSEKDRIKKEN